VGDMFSSHSRLLAFCSFGMTILDGATVCLFLCRVGDGERLQVYLVASHLLFCTHLFSSHAFLLAAFLCTPFTSSHSFLCATAATRLLLDVLYSVWTLRWLITNTPDLASPLLLCLLTALRAPLHFCAPPPRGFGSSVFSSWLVGW